MVGERRGGDGVREFRLEGLGLLLVAGVLIVLLGGAFYLGRWYERQVGPAAVPGTGGSLLSDPLANIEAPADVDRSADYFDDVQGGQKEAEPQREVPRDRPETSPAAAEEQSAAPPAEQQAAPAPAEERAAAPPAPAQREGSFFVQVFAGRDRQSAETLVRELTGKAYSVRLFSEREGRGALYKVRVGGYATREEASAVADALQQAGYSGAWVTTVE